MERKQKAEDRVGVVFTYENQRWFPIVGWSNSLLPTDRPSWSSRDGKVKLPRDDTYDGVPRRWLGPWELDNLAGGKNKGSITDSATTVKTDEEDADLGWEYASDFPRTYYNARSRTSCVRRRCWRRHYAVEPSKSNEVGTASLRASSPSGAGSTGLVPQFSMQVVSDVHLEFGDPAKNESWLDGFSLGSPSAPYLAICGDLTVNHSDRVLHDQLESYLDFLTARYECVFYIMGNHCVWYDTIAAATKRFRHLEKKYRGKFILLDCDTYDVPKTNVRLLGCTLWSDYRQEGHDLLTATKGQDHMLNDFRYIADFTPETYRSLHLEHKSWLEQECARACAEGKEIVVLTHHAPFVENLVPNVGVGGKLLKSGCLGTDLIRPGSEPGCFNTARFPGLRWWLYGHTHLCKRFSHHGVKVASNQMGYPDDRKSWGLWALNSLYPGFNAFDPAFKIDV